MDTGLLKNTAMAEALQPLHAEFPDLGERLFFIDMYG
jgi:hypothetical protein